MYKWTQETLKGGERKADWLGNWRPEESHSSGFSGFSLCLTYLAGCWRRWPPRNSNEGSQEKPSPKAKGMGQPSKTEHFQTIITLPQATASHTRACTHKHRYTAVAPTHTSKGWVGNLYFDFSWLWWGCNPPHLPTLLCHNGSEEAS